ncbi:uncharacterized protein [Nicotiana tomentosiformis]|uniref:uncharacterized protein n=1 Tax=Nicotiana tomentosiformis TaxID=4098 RepID=UPI00051C1C5C|nr:uncharacterized protein LOC104105847 [Nicotiana tomentosiformis]
MDNNQNTRPAGALPSDTEPNPKAQVNAVTLRNGRELEEVPEKRNYTTSPEGELVLKPVEENKKEKPEIVTRPPPPFSQRLQKQKDDAMYKIFLDILSQVHVNLPLVKNLQEVPKGQYKFDAILFVQATRIGVLRPTTITLQLADRSLVMPEGIIEDVLVRMGKFILPADFIVLDYEADEKVPIILGRSFLATGGSLIDVREGKLKMRVGNEEINFNVYKALKLPKHYEDL